MKSIAELQQEIRLLRRELSNMDARLDTLDQELLNYRDTSVSYSQYERIYEIAKIMPALKHPVMYNIPAIYTNYMSLLIMVAKLEGNLSDDQVLWLQRIVLQNENHSRLDYYMSQANNINYENVLLQMHEAVKTKYADNLLVDMMLLANFSPATSVTTYEAIASIATLIGKKEQNLKQLAKISVAFLKQEVTVLGDESSEIIYIDGRFGYLLSYLQGWKEKVRKVNQSQYRREAQNYQDKIAYFHNL